VPTLQEAFQRYIGEGKPCFEQGTFFSVEETLEILHRSHAKAFIAHPHLYDKASLVRKLLDLPFDGLECYYAKCYPQDEARWCRLAKERGLLVSGGSDYHGAFKPHTRLGSSWVDREVFQQIFGF
jgi:3',5'-nucleoside bisphosphate phosphatase